MKQYFKVMSNVRKIFKLAILVMPFMLMSCEMDEAHNDAVPSSGTAIMKLEGGLMRFDNSTTRGTTCNWEDGARLFLRFQTQAGEVEGEATYDAAEGVWIVNYYGAIIKGTRTKCSVFYFENPDDITNNSVELGPKSTVYSDVNGSYFFEGGVVLLYADMKPLTGRVRFKGEPGSTISFSGLVSFDRYRRNNGSLTMSGEKIEQTIGDNGYSPYVYVNFADTVDRRLSFYYDGYWLERNCEKTMLTVGSSGFVRVPSMKNRSGWKLVEGDKKEYYVNGVSFSMNKVEPGSYDIGVTKNEYGTSFLYHYTITVSKSYYMGETEVTAELWEAVMGDDYTHYNRGLYPVAGVSWNDCQTFVTKLSALTGYNFRLPTEAEWEHAARGGKKTKGYVYSGSNSVDEVAWYESNSGKKAHEVKGKTPNEIGLYDMSGNVEEWCQDWFADYPAKNQTDPQGPWSGTEHVARGGNYSSSEWSCRVSSRWGVNDGNWSNFGFRIASW